MRQSAEFSGKEFQKKTWIGIFQNKTTKDTRLGDVLLIPYLPCPASCVPGPKDTGCRTGPKDGC
eukprot:15100709-Ditylum_brightwellii.AAC.1